VNALQTGGRSVTLRACGVIGRRGPAHQPPRTATVDQQTQLLALAIAVIVVIVAIVLIMNRQRRDRREAAAESPFATSTEGDKRCPKCGMGNLWTDRTCISCGTRLKG
jgi:hypothetical protein